LEFSVKTLEVRSATKTIDARKILTEVSLQLPAGSFTALLGPSGCGKSTLLGLLAGFDRPTRGGVFAGDVPVNRPHPDRVLLFQDGALLPWRTALDNVAFGLEAAGVKRRAARERAREYLDLVGLAACAGQRPSQLSGGQCQRVALARALVVEPEVLLLDEPFSALDTLTRERLQDQVLDLAAKRGTTVVLVTHDVDEALYLADVCFVLAPDPGRIVASIEIAVPRPRRRDAIELAALKERVLGVLSDTWSGLSVPPAASVAPSRKQRSAQGEHQYAGR
jgi:ABC-type nitrate/sulfonate/bicarbonate transport system ATPase subunit